jgi:hypothetical protein
VSERELQLPEVADVLVSTTASLVNLAGIRLTEPDHKDVAKAKEAIDAARALLPLCPEDAVGPIRDALSQVQMLYVREQGPGEPGEPGEPAPDPADPAADERAKARAKIWTPPGT